MQELPNKLIYRLRVPLIQHQHDDSPFYWKQGFLQVQNAIAKSFIQLKDTSGIILPEILMNQFPSIQQRHFNDFERFAIIVSILILLAIFFPTINTVRYINIEKEKQLKEVMKLMGLPSWLHWSSWFVRTMVFMLITVTMIAAILQVIGFLIFVKFSLTFVLIIN